MKHEKLLNFFYDYHVILASSSQTRRNIVSRLGVPYDVLAPNIDEKAIRCDSPSELCLKIAQAKMDASVEKVLQSREAVNSKRCIIICSDQVTVCNGEVREKPQDPQEARRFLESYRVHPVDCVTALVVADATSNFRVSGVDTARVHFKSSLPDSSIEEAIKHGFIFNCAGGFTIDEPSLGEYILEIDGAPDSVEGLPLSLLEKLLTDLQQSLDKLE